MWETVNTHMTTHYTCRKGPHGCQMFRHVDNSRHTYYNAEHVQEGFPRGYMHLGLSLQLPHFDLLHSSMGFSLLYLYNSGLCLSWNSVFSGIGEQCFSVFSGIGIGNSVFSGIGEQGFSVFNVFMEQEQAEQVQCYRYRAFRVTRCTARVSHLHTYHNIEHVYEQPPRVPHALMVTTCTARFQPLTHVYSRS